MALLLVGNRLLAPQPLVQVEEWLAQTVLAEVLGFDAGQANDDRRRRAERSRRTLDALVPNLARQLVTARINEAPEAIEASAPALQLVWTRDAAAIAAAALDGRYVLGTNTKRGTS